MNLSTLHLADTGEFKKKFDNKIRLRNELYGHAFFSDLYCLIPKIKRINISKDVLEIVFENVKKSQHTTLYEALNNYNKVDLSRLLIFYSSLIDQTETIEASGGTKQFYVDRVHRLSTLEEDYQYFTHRNTYYEVNGFKFDIKRDLLRILANNILSIGYGPCIPSHGDFHELNIFTDGTLIDFEASGWNHIATEISTFLWHTMFVGNYLGPKYAKWSTSNDKPNISKEVILLSKMKLEYNLSESRKDLIEQFMSLFVNNIDHLTMLKIDSLIGNCIAFRLLTVFDLRNMDTKDKTMIFALANFFICDLSTFKKLDVLIKKND